MKRHLELTATAGDVSGPKAAEPPPPEGHLHVPDEAVIAHVEAPGFLGRLRYFLTPIDGRFEDLRRGPWYLNALRDTMAGLIVAMVAIPLAMGFAMASGLRPEQGIVGGAVAGLVGALFGGSKYQVYGPTAAFIPVIAGIMAAHDHGFLVLCGLLAGLILMVLGLTRVGRVVNLVPHSIVVGFTIGIAITIALSQVGEVLGIRAALGYSFLDKVKGIAAHVADVNPIAIVLAALVFATTKLLLKVSIYIPAPLVGIGLGTALSLTVFAESGLTRVSTKYGSIPTDFFVFTPPSFAGVWDQIPALVYFAGAIVFVSAIESLLCSRMADRLAGNTGRPFHPDKELWGQGLVQIIVPLLNGFPHTGALARTATNIKVGAVSPLAGVMKFIFKLLLAAYLATHLEAVPMACIGGILAYVAFNMVKPAEVREALAHGRFHAILMVYTAVAVVVTDFLFGVLTALVIFGIRQLGHVSVRVTPAGDRVNVRIDGALTFPAKPALADALATVPSGRSVDVDLNLVIMDYAGWKALHAWCAEYSKAGGRVRIDGLHETWSPNEEPSLAAPG
jgi:MFS superfamily sulfate permease-like transporter